MAVISQEIKNILDGVSQLPPEQRKSSQAEAQVNYLSYPGKGLMARPGFKHIAQLLDDATGLDRAYVHVIDRSPTERYYLVLAEGHISLYDAFTGEAQTINQASGYNYLDVPDADVVAEFSMDYRAPWRPEIVNGWWWGGPAVGNKWVFADEFDFGDYSFGPGGAYSFVNSQHAGGGGVPGVSHGFGFQAGFLDDEIPDGHNALTSYQSCTYPVPHRDSSVSIRWRWNTLDPRDGYDDGGDLGDTPNFKPSGSADSKPSGLSYILGLTLRQAGSDPSTGQRYCLDLGWNPTEGKHRLQFGKTLAGGANSYTGIGSETLIDPIPVEEWHTLRFVATNEPGSNDVILIAYLDDVAVKTTTHAFSTGDTLQDPGFAGFWVTGVGTMDPSEPAGNPSFPNGVPAGGTFFDDFKIGSRQALSDAVPFGLSHMKALTVGDETFVLNTLKKVEKKGDVTPWRSPEALVYVRQADYSTAYKITIDGTTITFTSGDGITAASRASITTDNIAQQLLQELEAEGDFADFTFTRIGSAIHVYREDEEDFTISTKDGLADIALLAIKGSVQRFEDLPLFAPEGMVVEVIGDPGSEFDNYWVQYDDSKTPGQAGVWKEIAAPFSEYLLNEATMPFVLKRSPGGEWSFGPGEWLPRKAGNDTTNPFPSFVGKAISDMFFEQRRLGFLADENVILSETGNSYNFFRKSAKALFDSDVIDVKASFGSSVKWHSATHWNERLLLWSDKAQMYLEGSPSLTPRTVSFNEVTAFEASPAAPPRVVGNRVWFSQIVEGHTRVGEMYVPQFTGKPTAREATMDIPSYIEGEPFWIVGTDQPNTIFVLADEDRDTIYVHSYLWAQDTKVQSSWSKWVLPSGSTIVSLDFYRGTLAAIVARSDGLYLETASIGELMTPTGIVRLDRRIHSTDEGVSVAVDGSETKWTLPFAQASGLVLVNATTGEIIPSEQPTSTTIRTTGDAGNITATAVYIGLLVPSTYTLSRIYWRKYGGGQEYAETDGRLRLGYVKFRTATGDVFSIVVTPTGRSQYTYTNTGLLPEFKAHVAMPNDQVTISATYSGIKFHALTSVDWEGTFSTRHRRV